MAKFYQHMQPGETLGKITKLKYIDGLVCIELNEADIECRYVLSEPGAIWWLHWLSVKNKYSLNSSNILSLSNPKYLA